MSVVDNEELKLVLLSDFALHLCWNVGYGCKTKATEALHGIGNVQVRYQAVPGPSKGKYFKKKSPSNGPSSEKEEVLGGFTIALFTSRIHFNELPRLHCLLQGSSYIALSTSSRFQKCTVCRT